jgi:hypothetical protein
MKTYGRVEDYLHASLISALEEGGNVWSTSRPGQFFPRNEPIVSVE